MLVVTALVIVYNGTVLVICGVALVMVCGDTVLTVVPICYDGCTVDVCWAVLVRALTKTYYYIYYYYC